MAKKMFWIILMCISGSMINQGMASPVQPVSFSNGKAEIILKDYLNHPFYWWPSTLLSYPIHFDDDVRSAENLRLERNGEAIPFQLSRLQTAEGKLKTARLHFISDLPVGATHRFVLKTGQDNSQSTVTSSPMGDTAVLVSTDRFSVIIPMGRYPNLSGFPGPYSAVKQGGTLMGMSRFTGTAQVTSLQTTLLEKGPLFQEYRLVYAFNNGGKYKATLRVIAGMDFFELTEQMEGLDPGEASWKMNWRGFDPTHRQAPNHPYQRKPNKEPGFGRYDWEPVAPHIMDHPQGLMASEQLNKIYMELGMYEPWFADKTLTSMLFWDETRDISRGIFINRMEDWNDHEYSIWDSSPTLNITFYYENGQLRWHYPLVTGTRSTAVSIYDHQKDIDFMADLEEMNKRKTHPDGFKYDANMNTLSWNAFMQNRYGTIHLNKVKNWTLSYDPEKIQPPVFDQKAHRTTADLREDFLYNGYVIEAAVSGTRQNSSFAPVPARRFRSWTVGFNTLWSGMTKAELDEFIPMYLMMAYLAEDEEHMPMKHMLAGHPNFLADIKSIPAMVAFLFPEHPEAENWANMFEKYVELNTRFHTRPDVDTWDAKGGRWTENLGTYVWAFLHPTSHAAYLLWKFRSGKNRMVTPQTSQIGFWILNALSAPYDGENIDFYRDGKGELHKHYWGVVREEEGPRRVHPPQGAHSARRKPSKDLWLLGQFLHNYDPLLAENLMHVSRPTDFGQAQTRERKDPHDIMFPEKNFNRGTPPDLKTIKMTGYGNVLRAGVNTPEELSVHLIQIDNGPNYRWGIAAEGGCGMIYYFADGKSYSHNGKEDVGDRRAQDTDFITNFGVFKNGAFRSIGRNVLHKPLYNLGTMQFAEITSDTVNGQSWPEYISRSVMLVGTDYFVTFDDVFSRGISGRYSWFTHPREDLPHIDVISTDYRLSRDSVKKTVLKTSQSKGVWYDSNGDFLVLVSHKKDFVTRQTDFGGTVSAPDGTMDYIFRDDEHIHFEKEGLVFKGTAGIIRVPESGTPEMALFHGKQIGNDIIRLSSNREEAGISALTNAPDDIQGQFYAYHDTRIKLEWMQGIPENIRFYLDGKPVRTQVKDRGWELKFPSGHHHWQITSGDPVPGRPLIKGYENKGSGVRLLFREDASTERYRLEVSEDMGNTWKLHGETRKSPYTLNGYPAGTKIHVRLIARNGDKQSQASAMYPVYFRNEAPHHPEGLKITLEGSGVSLKWGEVLGVQEYRIYRRAQGSTDYRLVYQGQEREYRDAPAANAIYEYTVTAVNDNGESEKAYPVNTDPGSWLNWNPRPWERFRKSHRSRAFEEDLNNREIYYPE